MEFIIIWIILCFVVGSVGDKRKIGFGGAFLWSFFLSPLIGFIIAFNSDKLIPKEQPNPLMLKLINEGNELVKSNEFDKAIEKYKLALTYSIKAPMTNYKLAKLYSLKKDSSESIKYLATAIQSGFKNFDAINNDVYLSYLRSTSEFKEFASNSYTLSPNQIESPKSLSRVDELERIASLFEKGVLTKQEFENEKQIILARNN